jgi:hypothetical protein
MESDADSVDGNESVSSFDTVNTDSFAGSPTATFIPISYKQVYGSKRNQKRIESSPPLDSFDFKWEYGFYVGEVVWSIEPSDTPEDILPSLRPCTILKKTLIKNVPILDQTEINETIQIPVSTSKSSGRTKERISPVKSKLNSTEIKNHYSNFQITKQDVLSTSESSSDTSDSDIYINPRLAKKRITGYKRIRSALSLMKERFNLLVDHRYEYEVSFYPKDSQNFNIRMDNRLLPLAYTKSRIGKNANLNICSLQALWDRSTWALPNRSTEVIPNEPIHRRDIVDNHQTILMMSPNDNEIDYNVKSLRPVNISTVFTDLALSYCTFPANAKKHHAMVCAKMPQVPPPFPGHATDLITKSITTFRIGGELIHIGDIVRVGSKSQSKYFDIISMAHVYTEKEDKILLTGEYVIPFPSSSADNEGLRAKVIESKWTSGSENTIDAKKVSGRYHARFHEMKGVPWKRTLVMWNGKEMSKGKRRLKIDWDAYDGGLLTYNA